MLDLPGAPQVCKDLVLAFEGYLPEEVPDLGVSIIPGHLLSAKYWR